MDESPSAQTQPHIYTAPRTNVSQNQGKFRIHFNFPGRAVPDHDDHGYGPLATVVESFMDPGTLIRMHQHRNEEIISWVPGGVMRHDDRQGNNLITNPEHMMVMNAGNGFWHAEETLDDDPPLRMLQIFVRPHSLDLEPGIQHISRPVMSAIMLAMSLRRPTQLIASSTPRTAGRNSARNIVARTIAMISPIIMSMVFPSVPFSATD